MTTIVDPTSQDKHGTDLLRLAEQRMKWLQRRESVLAGNVANANTPNYKSKDISPFQGILKTHNSVALTLTNPKHISQEADSASYHTTGTLASINGNQVSLEDELTKIADTNDKHRFAITVYGRYMSMYNIALGGSGSSS
ncbi:flagellar basal body protein [Acetobacteraceae bacterium ESL0709]|nr:flagellar basal body protein [Acetobacteraceae bacterium ESL0697]MDF7679038.1 flagellar basal body protein [Acetobacteraceae bacterium ESL0709]